PPQPPRAAIATPQRETAIQARLFDEPVEIKSIRDVTHHYQILRTPAERSRLVATLLSQSAICIGIAPSAMHSRDALPLGIAFSFAPHSASYVVCPDLASAALAILEEFRGGCERRASEKVGYYLKPPASLLPRRPRA